MRRLPRLFAQNQCVSSFDHLPRNVSSHLPTHRRNVMGQMRSQFQASSPAQSDATATTDPERILPSAGFKPLAPASQKKRFPPLVSPPQQRADLQQWDASDWFQATGSPTGEARERIVRQLPEVSSHCTTQVEHNRARAAKDPRRRYFKPLPPFARKCEAATAVTTRLGTLFQATTIQSHGPQGSLLAENGPANLHLPFSFEPV